MAVEIQLPDLPEITIGGPRRPRQPWHVRLRDAVSSYLPLLLMAALALATWWLVKNTPGAPGERSSAVDSALPDYTMQRFTLQRFAPDGRLLAELPLPARCPTMPCFGGPDLRTLYVTTASHKRPEAELAALPWSGRVLALRVDVPGLPVNFARL